MPTQFFADLSKYDLAKPAYTIDDVRAINPQRYEMEQLSYVVACDVDQNVSVAVRRLAADEWWTRGHIPGRPLFPGVLMVEAAAQLCSFHYHKAAPEDRRFFGFGGIDAVKFRGEVKPGDTFVIMGRMVELRSRRAVFDSQGVVGERLVFEGRITGMPL